MTKEFKTVKQDPCFCGSLDKYGKPKLYKNCCRKKVPEITNQLLEKFRDRPREPFEKGGFLTGRPFISETFQERRVRAVKNIVYLRPLDETFHTFILARFSEILTME